MDKMGPYVTHVQSMKQLLIFCEGYPQIENALYVATNNCQDRSITIAIPGSHPDLFRFFQVINERVFNNTIKLICYDIYQPRRGNSKGINMKKILLLPADIIMERRHLKSLFDRYFAELNDVEIFFSSKWFGTYSFYFLRRLSKTNTLVYIHDPAYVFPVDTSTPKNIRGLINLIIMKFIYDRDVVWGRIPHTEFPCIPDKFFEKNVDKVIGKDERDKMMKDFDLSRFKAVFDAVNYRVIYFHQDLVQDGYITDGDTFRRELAEIFNILSKYFPENEVARKYHPCYPGDKTTVEYGVVIEDYIPGEFLYNDNIEIYLSIFSCAIANVESGLAVSIADLITFRDDETREQFRDMLSRISRSEILYPKSLDEFEGILNKVVVKHNLLEL